MSEKENKERYIQLVEELIACKGDIAKLRSFMEKHCAPGYVNHNARRGDMNQDQTAEYYAELWDAFPDFTVNVDDIVAEGDKLAVRYTAQGTHKGAFMGIPATGKRATVMGMQISKRAGGKTVEMWELPDALGILVQLGVIPDPSKSSVAH